MKKLFSILLTVAMLLSAVAFPAVVSAEGETVTLSLAVKKNDVAVDEANKVYPGDTITVDVIATGNQEFTASYSNFFLKYDATKLTKGALPEKFSEGTTGELSYVNDSALTITTEGVVLGTLTFTVNDTAVDSAAFSFASTTMLPSFVIGEGLTMTDAAYVVTPASVTISASSAVPQIKIGENFVDIPESGATYNDATGITVKAVAEGNVDVTLSAAEQDDVDLSSGAEHTITVGGTYTITVAPVGGTEKTYTFTFAKFSVDATLAIANPSDVSYADGYAAGEKFEMPVTISGLNEAQASMVKFTVDFDADALAFDGFDNALYEVSVEEGVYTVIYNKTAAAENALANNATVANLSFTVLENAAYGTQIVTIEALDLALVTTVVDPTASDIGTAQATATATIVPAEGTSFAVVTDEQEGFTNQAYSVAVAPVANAESKVYYSETELADPAADNLFTNGSDLVENNFTVNKPGYYYVVTKIGTNPAVYEIANAVASQFDGTAPVIADIAAAESWTSTLEDNYTLDVTVNDEEGGSGVKTLEYKLSAEGEYAAAATTDAVEIPAGTSAEKIWLKATDVAGNVSAEKEVIVKLDGDAPTATLEAGTQSEGEVDFTITANDATSGIASVVVMKGEEVFANVTEVAEYACSTTENGSYTVVVTDNAGNTFETAPVVVAITEAVVLPIKVAINEEKEAVVNGFTAGEDVNNGTFMYVRIEKQADVEGYTTTYLLNDEELVFVEDVAEITGTAGEYTLTTTTTNDIDPTDVKSATYNFNIATTQATMKSVNTDAYFSMLDYAHLIRVTSAGTGADQAFTGGLLSADVNADMQITAEDAAAVVNALRDVKYVGIYDFAIMNGVTDDGATLN